MALEDKKDKKYAIKNNCIGVVHYWGFKDSNLFLNFEKGKVEPLKNLSEVELISDKKFQKLYKERNVHEGNEREKNYGKVHESWLKIMGQGTTDKTGKWSNDFARDLGGISGIIGTYKECLQHFGEVSHKEASKKPLFSSIAMKHLFGPETSSGKAMNKVFDEEITDEEIEEIISEYKSLPKDWNKFKPTSEEMEYFTKTIKASNKKIKVKSIDSKKIISDEKELLKNITDKKLTINYHGHVPYGGFYNEVKRYLENRQKHVNKDVNAFVVEPFIGKVFKTDNQCYLCGCKLGYVIKSSTEVDAFKCVFPEGTNEFVDAPIQDYSTCELSDKKLQTHKFDLSFPSGVIVIDNYFVDDKNEYLFNVPKDKQWDEEFSLQTLKGRFNRQDYIAKTHNAGYAQMGNMSVDIFISKDKKRIIIGSEPDEDGSKEDKEFNKEFKSNYKKIGDISLSVWRWECADKSLLKNSKTKGKVEAKIVPGIYTVSHYYDNTSFKEKRSRYNVYSDLVLKK